MFPEANQESVDTRCRGVTEIAPQPLCMKFQICQSSLKYSSCIIAELQTQARYGDEW